MSSFDGHLLEYPYVSIDRFNGSNLQSAVYFLSHCHKDHIEGLLEDTFLRRLRDSKLWLYTSATTKNLILSDPEMEHLVEYVVGLPVNQPREVTAYVHDEDGQNFKEESIVVTLISAGHCVGSVMILFEGKEGAVLYTGDFRLTKKEIMKVKWLHSGERVRSLRSVYVDTTFCSPKIAELPTRMQTKDVLIEIIGSWLEKGGNHYVHLKCKGKYGYEFIMKEVAKHFKMRSTESFFKLPCGLRQSNGKKIELITIVPSSLYFCKNGIPDDFRIFMSQQRLWRVVHSMHASYNEIREVIGYLEPDEIYPCVPPIDCQDILVAYERLQDLLREPKMTKPKQELEKEELEIDEEKLFENGMKSEMFLSPKSIYKQCTSFDLRACSPNLKSPPPMRNRKKRKNKHATCDLRQKLEKITKQTTEEEDTQKLLDEAFGELKSNNLETEATSSDQTEHLVFKNYSDLVEKHEDISVNIESDGERNESQEIARTSGDNENSNLPPDNPTNSYKTENTKTDCKNILGTYSVEVSHNSVTSPLLDSSFESSETLTLNSLNEPWPLELVNDSFISEKECNVKDSMTGNIVVNHNINSNNLMICVRARKSIHKLKESQASRSSSKSSSSGATKISSTRGTWRTNEKSATSNKTLENSKFELAIVHQVSQATKEQLLFKSQEVGETLEPSKSEATNKDKLEMAVAYSNETSDITVHDVVEDIALDRDFSPELFSDGEDVNRKNENNECRSSSNYLKLNDNKPIEILESSEEILERTSSPSDNFKEAITISSEDSTSSVDSDITLSLDDSSERSRVF